MSFKEIIEREKNEIIITLIKQGNANRTINYSQFLSLYAQYKEIMSEEEFASILGIHIATFRRIRDKVKIQIYTRGALIYYNITMKWDMLIQKR